MTCTTLLALLLLSSLNGTAPLPAQPETQKTAAPAAQPPVKTPDSSASIITIKKVGDRPEFVVNASLPLTGSMSALGSQVQDGMSLFFTKIKSEFDKGMLYHLNVLDDGFNTATVQENMEKLLPQSPIFLSLLGTRSVLASKKKTQAKGMLALFPMEGADSNRKPELRNIVYFRPSYEQEIEALVAYAVKKLHKKNIGIFYEDSDSGKSAYESTKKILKKYDLSLAADASYPAQSLNITRAVYEVIGKAPHVIICVAKERPTYYFVREIIRLGLHKVLIMGLSGLTVTQEKLKTSRGISIVTSSVVPNPITSELQIAKEYREANKKYTGNKQLTPYAFEGYINAALLHEILKIAPRPFTTNSIVQTIEGLKHVNFKGLVLKFDPATRTLYHDVFIDTGSPKKTPSTKKSDAS